MTLAFYLDRRLTVSHHLSHYFPMTSSIRNEAENRGCFALITEVVTSILTPGKDPQCAVGVAVTAEPLQDYFSLMISRAPRGHRGCSLARQRALCRMSGCSVVFIISSIHTGVHDFIFFLICDLLSF